jgi:hypothetical protein
MATKNLQARINKIKRVLDPNNLANVGFPVFYRNTPVKTGYARNHTQKINDEISANYPYARRLDNGWSKQSPNGMVKPTIAAIRAYIKAQLGI